MDVQKKRKPDNKDEAEEQRIKAQDSADAMMAFLPLKKSKCMHRRRRSKTAKEEGAFAIEGIQMHA